VIGVGGAGQKCPGGGETCSPRALVSDVLAGAEGREALGRGSDERREEGDR
jgi:hypothetical protein